MEKELKPVDTITPYEAGRMIHANAEFIRAGLRSKRFDFGTAIPPEKPGGRWKYKVIRSKFLAFAGVREGVNTSENCK